MFLPPSCKESHHATAFASRGFASRNAALHVDDAHVGLSEKRAKRSAGARHRLKLVNHTKRNRRQARSFCLVSSKSISFCVVKAGILLLSSSFRVLRFDGVSTQ